MSNGNLLNTLRTEQVMPLRIAAKCNIRSRKLYLWIRCRELEHQAACQPHIVD